MPDTSLADAKKWCERTLKNAFPSVQIGYENLKFAPPASAFYFITQFVVQSAPENPSLSAGYARENCQFQVFVLSELNKGTAEAMNTALAVREVFKRGISFNEGTTLGHVLRTPQISSSVQIGNRFCYPVLIPVTLQVTTGV